MKKKLFRMIVGGLSLSFILFLWDKKGLSATEAPLRKNKVVPAVVAAIAASLLKAAALFGGAMLVKTLIARLKNKTD